MTLKFKNKNKGKASAIHSPIGTLGATVYRDWETHLDRKSTRLNSSH